MIVGKETMKVKDLIKQLRKCNPNASVRVVEEIDNGDPNFWLEEVDERRDQNDFEVLLIGRE